MQKVLVGLRGAATCRDTAIPLRRRLRVRVPSLPRPTRTHRRTGHIGYTFSFFRGSDAVQGVFGDGRMAAWPSLPDGVEIAHRNRYRLAGISALGDVEDRKSVEEGRSRGRWRGAR